MSSKSQPNPTARRKTWERPRVERLIAVNAENLYGNAKVDGIYSTS